MPNSTAPKKNAGPLSMTGFARQTENTPWGELSCEVRSINHRYLDPSIRLPDTLRALEPFIREQLRQVVVRGKIEISVGLDLAAPSSQSIHLNAPLMAALKSALQQVEDIFAHTAPIDPLAVLAWPGLIEEATIDRDAVEQHARRLIQQTLTLLVEHRQREGAVLKGHIDDRLLQISQLAAAVRQQMPEILAAQRQRLQQRLSEAVVSLDENRIEQEIVLLANKLDVAEELDRLDAHRLEVAHILNQPGPMGRRLDFMMQELNREANTLSSKSLASETTQAAVSIKVLIEQMREQIQNIE